VEFFFSILIRTLGIGGGRVDEDIASQVVTRAQLQDVVIVQTTHMHMILGIDALQWCLGEWERHHLGTSVLMVLFEYRVSMYRFKT
jgi:hypothetical protein